MNITAILLTIVILGVGLFILMISEHDWKNKGIVYAAWSVYTCVMFLPAMHERYTYLLDILLFVLTCYECKKYMKYFIIGILSSAISYGNFLFSLGFDLKFVSLCFVSAYLGLTYAIFREKMTEIINR
jgi:hypothetical protein